MRSGIYFDERQLRKRRRILKFKIYVSIAVFLILIAAIAYLIVYSRFFQIKNIEVVGNGNVKDEEIIEKIKENLNQQSRLASFLGPNNILIWNNNKISDEILKIYPQIADSTVEKDYFNRQIKIILKEREKLGIWCVGFAPAPVSSTSSQPSLINGQLPLDKCWWFDNQGIVFAEAPLAEGNLINKVDDFSGRLIELGKPILEEKFLSNLLKIFGILEKSGLNIKSLELENLRLQEIIADPLTSSWPKIYFSLRIDPDFGLAALESLKKIGLEKINYIDLRVENRAYYKLK